MITLTNIKHVITKLPSIWKKHKDRCDISFEHFLEQLEITVEQYILALRTSIKSPTVFLKRQPSDIRINPYMKNLLEIYGANHDIQYITDPYACAVYIVAYMSKAQRGMSNLMAKASKQARNGNTDIRQVRAIGNKFVNAVEVSAQEAVYLLLQLPITHSSRQVQFINTSPESERTFLLKNKKSLKPCIQMIQMLRLAI